MWSHFYLATRRICLKERNLSVKILPILKTGGKIFFNVSAIAGIVATSAIGISRALPREAKDTIYHTIHEFESPIEQALTNPEDCFASNQWPIVQKYKSDEEYKKYCLTNSQQKEALGYSQVLYDKSSEILRTLPLSDASAEIHYKHQQSMWDCDSEAQAKVPEYDESHFGRGASTTYEDGLAMIKHNNEVNTCYNRKESDLIYELTGERLPYYDRINKVVIYGEEQ